MAQALRSFFQEIPDYFAQLAGLDWQAVLIRLGLAVLATLALILLLRINRWISRRLEAWITAWKGTRVRALKFQAQEILSEGDLVRILSGSVRILRLLILLVLVYSYLQFVFTLIPWTRGLSAQLLESTTQAIVLILLGVVGYIPSLILILFILLLGYYLIRLAQLIFRGIERGRIEIPGFYPEWAQPT